MKNKRTMLSNNKQWASKGKKTEKKSNEPPESE